MEGTTQDWALDWLDKSCKTEDIFIKFKDEFWREYFKSKICTLQKGRKLRENKFVEYIIEEEDDENLDEEPDKEAVIEDKQFKEGYGTYDKENNAEYEKPKKEQLEYLLDEEEEKDKEVGNTNKESIVENCVVEEVNEETQMENKELAEWDKPHELWVSKDEFSKLDPIDEEEELDREFNEQLEKEENSFICDDEGYNNDDDDEDYHSHDKEDMVKNYEQLGGNSCDNAKKEPPTSSSYEMILLAKNLWRSTLEQLSSVEIAQATDMCCMWSSITPKSGVQINTFKVPWGSRTISNESSSRNLWWDSISERFTILLKQFLENLTKENNASEEDLPKEELEDSSMRINEQLIKIRLLTAQGFLRKSQFNIPHEVALRCLAYLPSFTRAIARCVSRAWRDALHPYFIRPIRQYLKLPIENWIFISMIPARFWNSVRDYRWLLLDPCSGRIQRLSYPAWLTCGPLRPHPQFIRIIGSPDVVGRVYFFITALSNQKPQIISLCHNMDNNEWRSLPPMITSRGLTLACAGLGKFIYVAGGNSPSNNWNCVKSAERYDTEQNAWEALPDMNFTRQTCSGFAMDGKFYVIGGYDPLNRTIHTSAEFFDPERGDWTVVPNMWPDFVGANCNGNIHSLIAVVDNILYAAKHRSGEIFKYDQSNNSWTFSGSFDHTGLCTLLGLGDKLWVLFQDRIEGLQAFACKPNQHQPEEPLEFRRIDTGFERCADSMSIYGQSSMIGAYTFG